MTHPEEFTCLLPVHGGDEAEAFAAALSSVATAPERPAEIFICVDGEIDGALAGAVEAGANRWRARVVANAGPRGLHHNLNHAAREVRTPWIARMDADDLSLADRFERQLRALSDNPKIDVLGGAILEIAPDGARRRRTVPGAHADILKMSRWRSPMNHQTVVMRTALLRRCGGYPDIPRKEDYALWLKMLAAGGRFANLPEDLVHARLGLDFAARRTGLRNVASEWALYRLRRQTPGLGGASAVAAFVARTAALALKGPGGLIYERLLRRP